MRSERTYPHDAKVVAHARRFVTETIGEAPRALLCDVELMTSELVSNALLHAASECTVTVETHDRLITVAVSDAGAGQPTVRTPDDHELSGRGLMIVAALASDWGIEESAPAPGKVVWFRVERPESTDPPHQDGYGSPGGPTRASRRPEAEPARLTRAPLSFALRAGETPRELAA